MSDQNKIIFLATLDIKDEFLLPLIKAEFDKENITYQIRTHHDTAYNGIFLPQKGLADIFVVEGSKASAQKILNNLLT